MQLAYATVGSNQLEEAKSFYDELLGSVGMKTFFDHPSGGRLYSKRGEGVFGVLGPHDGNPATVGNGTMIGFGFDTHEEIDAFHAKALELGASCDGAPGPRGPEGSKVYFGYFRDLDGNKLCAYSFG